MSDDIMPPKAPPDPSIWRQPEFEKYRKYTIEKDFIRLFMGEMDLPNFEPIEHWQALAASMGYGKTIESFDKSHPRDGSYNVRTKAKVGDDTGDAIYHLNCGQGGGFTGEGVVVMRRGWNAGPESILTGRFAICKHEKVEGEGANHMRGWHPGHCGKCGMDMSVDSGD